jgi:hypothetical protein
MLREGCLPFPFAEAAKRGGAEAGIERNTNGSDENSVLCLYYMGFAGGNAIGLKASFFRERGVIQCRSICLFPIGGC